MNVTGLIASSQNLAYTGSKFVGGLLADRVSSRVLFSVGMVLSGLITVAFTGEEKIERGKVEDGDGDEERWRGGEGR